VLGDDVRAMLDKADHIVKAWTETMAQAEAIQTDRPEAEAKPEPTPAHLRQNTWSSFR
jgi:hypothetical protein